MNTAFINLIFALVLSFSSALAAQDKAEYGRFDGDVCTTWNQPDHISMTLCAAFKYIDPQGNAWDVPSGTVIDGASIPRPFWSIVGNPFQGPYRKASVVHDHYCVTKTRPWKNVHRMFYYAMLAAGTDEIKAKLMYYAVYVGGPRWKEVHVTNHEPRAFPMPGDIDTYEVRKWFPHFNEEKAKHDIARIEQQNLSLEQIEDLALEASSNHNEPADVIRMQ